MTNNLSSEAARWARVAEVQAEDARRRAAAAERAAYAAERVAARPPIGMVSYAMVAQRRPPSVTIADVLARMDAAYRFPVKVVRLAHEASLAEDVVRVVACNHTAWSYRAGIVSRVAA